MVMMMNNYAYIDGANLHGGMNTLHWQLDYIRFRIWLTEKYQVKVAHIFLGFIPRYQELYAFLQQAGFVLIFKEVVYDNVGKAKGNCDADLVLQAVCDAYENKCDQAILVSSDGDYAGLVKFLMKRDQLSVVLSPHGEEKCSILLKRTHAHIAYIGDQRSILELQKEKAPDRDKTL